MICHVKQSFEVQNKYGEKWSARNGDIVVPPDWVVSHEFFKALCDCGKITVHMDSKSIELEQAKEAQEAKEVQQGESVKRGRK